MLQRLHPDFIRDLDAYSKALLRKESLLIRIEAKRRSSTLPNPAKTREQA